METVIAERLIELRAVTPSMAMFLMNDFESVCRGYFNRGATFKQALFDAYLGQTFDKFMTDFECRDQGRLPSLSGDRPELYDNIEAVFKGVNGERYPFNGMLTIDLQVFRRGYEYDGGGESGQVGTYKNRYLEQWTLEINLAKMNEQATLQSIKYYALRRYRPWSRPLIEEDLGWRRQVWGNRAEMLRARMYEDKRWAWVYSAFEMAEDEPEILRELRDEDVD